MSMGTITPDIILSLRGVSKSYADLLAVNDLSLDIQRGEIFGFLGPNGAGKTTTINMICGLLKPDGGDILVNDRSLDGHYRECKRVMGLCPENIVIWEGLTCLEQLTFIGQQYDLKGDEAKKKSLELLEILGLYDKRDKLARTLSGGMKRKLNIALALVHNPQILILDEPQAGLDPQSRVLVREYVRSLSSQITVILTTHDMHEADRLSDRVAIIDHGQLLVLDTPDGLKNSIGAGDILEIKFANLEEDEVDLLKRTFPGDLPAGMDNIHYEGRSLRLVSADTLGVLPVLLEAIQRTELVIEDVAMRKKTLEDVFIALTGRKLRS
jgi:ABC-2 type transport system ATP-binding protein